MPDDHTGPGSTPGQHINKGKDLKEMKIKT